MLPDKPKTRIVDDSEEYGEFETRAVWFLYGCGVSIMVIIVIRLLAI